MTVTIRHGNLGAASTQIAGYVRSPSPPGPNILPPAPFQLRERVAGAHGLLTTLSDRVDSEVLRAAPDLKVIANYAVGFDNIDIEACRARGVIVTNTPDVLTNATADLTFALLLAAARQLLPAAASVTAGEWATWEPRKFLGAELAGHRLVLVGGNGRIGSAVRRRAEAFEMDVISVGRDDDLHAALRTADDCPGEVHRGAGGVFSRMDELARDGNFALEL